MEKKLFFYDVSGYDKCNLQQLDSIRGIMALLILGCHFFATFSSPWPKWGIFAPFSILGNAGLGLCYFFVLSGFVISYSLQKKQRNVTLLKYAINRFMRLLPPVAVSILLMFFFQKYHLLIIPDYILTKSEWASNLYQFQPNESLVNPIYDIFFNSFLGGDVMYNCNLWAIRFEFLVPLLLVIINPFLHNKKVRTICDIVTIFLIIFLVEKRWFFLACMLLGMLLCYYLRQLKWFKVKTSFVVIGGAISIIYLFPSLIQKDFLSRWVNLVFALLILIFIVKEKNEKKNRLLDSKLLCLVGKVSYEIYVFHLFFLFTFSSLFIQFFDSFLAYNFLIIICYVLTIIITVVISVIFHKYVSLKLLRFKLE